MQSKKLDDFERRLRIDSSALDRELIEQAELQWHASKAYLTVLDECEAQKKHVKEFAAERSLAIRRRLESEDKKVTEAIMTAAIDSDPKVNAERDRYLELTNQANHWEAMRDCVIARGFALKDLCGLAVAGMLGSNSIRGKAASQVSDAAYEERVEAMNQKRQEKKLQRRQLDD